MSYTRCSDNEIFLTFQDQVKFYCSEKGQKASYAKSMGGQRKLAEWSVGASSPDSQSSGSQLIYSPVTVWPLTA